MVMECKRGLVSVVIPCYNQAVYLSETLDSLLKQKYNLWEGIVVDDGSPDNTKQVALEYVEKDSRFKYVYKPNGGLSSARNKGISLAVGEFILPLDADDIIQPEYLEEAVNAFQKNPDTKLVYCLGQFFGERTGLWNLSYKGYKSLLIRNSLFCSVIYRREDALQIGGYDERMLLGYEDWEFLIRFLDESSVVHKIPQVLFYYRTKAVSMITEADKRREELEEYIYMKHHDKYFMYYGGTISGLRRLEHYDSEQECTTEDFESRLKSFREQYDLELGYYKQKINRYRNKWYRRWCRAFRDTLRKFRGRS